MRKLGGFCRMAAASVAVCVLMGAGCPNGNLIDQLGNLIDQLPIDEQQLLDLVDQFLNGGASQDEAAILNDPNFAPEDAGPAFGEDPSLYEVSPDKVEFPEDPVFAAVGAPGGRPPLHGRLVGRFWNENPDSDSGSSPGLFRGQWFSADGQLAGYIRGHYEPVPADELPDGLAAGGMFRGRYVDREGRFRGYILGRYGRNDQAERGIFSGRWIGRDGENLGALRGHWIDEPGSGGGMFAGRWAAFDVCSEADDFADSPDGNFDPQMAQASSRDDLETDVASLEAFAQEVVDPNEVPQDQFPLDEFDDPELANPDHLPCVDLSGPHGLIRGSWQSYDPSDPNVPNPNADGIMFGRWRDVHGGSAGYVLGVWAYDDAPSDGDANAPAAHDAPDNLRGRFFAHIIADSGEVLGFVRGRFGHSPRGLGIFRGEMFDNFDNRVGGMRGRWVAGEQGDGHFVGAWNAPGVEDTPGGPDVPPPDDVNDNSGPDSPSDANEPGFDSSGDPNDAGHDSGDDPNSADG